jgi:hypothetical protein
VRAGAQGGRPDLNAWAARHGLHASARYAQLGEGALVLWHGTTRGRAEKVITHGLFHKRGLWTARPPAIAHSYCRGRAARYGAEGAMVCIILDGAALTAGRDYTPEKGGEIIRFHGGLPPAAVEYVLLADRARFTGSERPRSPRPWPGGRFKRGDGGWVPVQVPPVRYDAAGSYSTLEESVQICLDRLLGELGEVTALEVFSVLYAAVQPWDALRHRDVLALVADRCAPGRRYGRWQTFRARSE